MRWGGWHFLLDCYQWVSHHYWYKRSGLASVLRYGQKNEETEKYELVINPKIASLYNDDGWTGQDWEQRKQLMGKPLALWLHGFYSTHSHPFDYKIETLWRLCGSEAKELYKFKQTLSEAIKDLSVATSWNCRIENDKLQVIKSPEQLISQH
jgi:hypothetical protein